MVNNIDSLNYDILIHSSLLNQSSSSKLAAILIISVLLFLLCLFEVGEESFSPVGVGVESFVGLSSWI